MRTLESSRAWQRWPVLFWVAGTGALCSLLAGLLQEAETFVALLMLSPYAVAMTCAVIASPIWSKGVRGVLLGLPILLGLPFQLYLAVAAGEGKWSMLYMFWITAIYWLVLALWWPLVIVLVRCRESASTSRPATRERGDSV